MNTLVKTVQRALRESRSMIRMSGSSLAFLSLVLLLFGSTRANAACGMTDGGSRNAISIPTQAHGAADQDADFAPFGGSIVGLWHVIYTAGGSIFNETLDQWHIDGTEFENAWLPPDTGNICFGVWKQVAPRTVRLHHIGWLFTPGSTPPTASGTFTLDETNTLSRDGKTYTGTFTFKTFDANGAPTGVEVTGTIAATRITVD